MYLIKKESNAVLKTWTGGASACNTVTFQKSFRWRDAGHGDDCQSHPAGDAAEFALLIRQQQRTSN